jgi:cell division transport system permease protein
MAFSTIIGTTSDNIRKNRWLAFATIVVIGIVFTITTFFITLAISTRQAVSYFEKKAQIIVYFKSGTTESDIMAFKNKVNDTSLVESVRYISEDEAISIYAKDYADQPDLLDSVSVGTLPASLELRAKNIDNLYKILEKVNKEKESNPYIDDVWYFKDVVDRIKDISTAINYGSIALISSLGVVTFALIILTIGFNIRAQSDEIQVMHLVGSTDSFIRAPYILEGAFYGATGGFLSSLFMTIPWIVGVELMKNSGIYLSMSTQMNDLGLGLIINIQPLTVILFVLTQILVGIIIGSIGSGVAVVRYLNLAEK